MVLLAARLGLRIGDIRNLKLHDIDWAKKQISIIQHKTQKALLLPLPEAVGWAVIDYLKSGRPVTDSPNVFVRHRPPYDAFSVTSSLNYIFSSVMVRAGQGFRRKRIRMSAGIRFEDPWQQISCKTM